jgi:predicted NBD/HSP70 family sugar kinase
MTKKIAQGLAAICCVVNPEVLIMGGAIMAQQDYFAPRLNKYYRSCCRRPCWLIRILPLPGSGQPQALQVRCGISCRQREKF